MSTTTSELLRSFFFNGAEAPAGGNITIDVLDSMTNAGLAAVAPTTISWSDARATGDNAVAS
jgi:UDP-N-acetylmuramoylalanine-D-glutamate ligase